MKILDRYILTTYLKTFISVFVILMLIFVLQTIWLYIKELAGKDLDIVVVGKFLIYFSPRLVTLVLPLTILLSSIMVFGSFAENYEFAAMKSTGISLQRAMAGLSAFIVLLAFLTFIFANTVIPWGEYNSLNLRKNIAKLKPAMVIAEGQFNDVIDYNIKVDKKSGDRGQFLDGVLIHKKNNKNSRGNHTTIVAKNGELVGSEESNVLKLILHEGYFYDDSPPKDYKDRQKRPMTKSSFETYTINIDLSGFNNQDMDEKEVSNKYSMLSMKDLSYTIDSLKTDIAKVHSEFSENLYSRTNLPVMNSGIKAKKDTIYTGDILDLFDTRKKVQLIDLATNSIKSTKQIVKVKKEGFKQKKIWMYKHVLAYHDKVALGFACVILFFVGAPLGALIRKGGLGLPMVVAILLFLTYHFIGIFAKESSEGGAMNPALAPWVSTLIMFPLSIYLTRRATQDRGLFEFDHLIEPIKKLLKIKPKEEKARKELPNEVAEIMANRELAPEKIDSKNVIQVTKLQEDFTVFSKFSFIFYIAAAILVPLFFILKNNKFPELALVSLQLGIIALFICLVYYVVSTIVSFKLYRHVPKSSFSKNPVSLILGYLFYPLSHFLRKNKINQDISVSLK
ncbi:YjgP/YjgQ family permease [Mangrovimonas sp. CR14]|uniref:LptF/LptG family permease n=1 Tax=Mangrovimonas sp. CR14 TaxID=2706120 RepID=UPI001420C4C5|nr:YjgP/YjgQ family permease [Mangrovimonas sp. CR14]